MLMGCCWWFDKKGERKYLSRGTRRPSVDASLRSKGGSKSAFKALSPTPLYNPFPLNGDLSFQDRL